MTEKIQNSLLLIISYFLIILGYIFSVGFFSFYAISVLLISFIFITILLKYKSIAFNKADINAFHFTLVFTLLISVTLSLYSPKSLYENINILKEAQFYIYILTFFLTLFLLINLKKRLENILFLFLVFLPILSHTLVVINSPSPKIDVYDFLQSSTSQILHFHNPYTSTFGEAYIYPGEPSKLYTYFPFSFILLIPSLVIFGEVRYTFIFSEILITWILWSMFKKNNSQLSIYIPLIFLYNPLNTFIVEQSWPEPIIVLLFTLFGYFYINNRSLLSILLLSSVFGIKQNLLLIAPLVIRLKNLSTKHLLGFIPLFIVVMFFLLISPQDFIGDTLIEPLTRKARTDSLSLITLLPNILDFAKNILFLSPILVLIYFFRKQKITVSKFLLYSSLIVMTFLLTSSNSFLNHYYLVSSLILLSLAFLWYEKSI